MPGKLGRPVNHTTLSSSRVPASILAPRTDTPSPRRLRPDSYCSSLRRPSASIRRAIRARVLRQGDTNCSQKLDKLIRDANRDAERRDAGSRELARVPASELIIVQPRLTKLRRTQSSRRFRVSRKNETSRPEACPGFRELRRSPDCGRDVRLARKLLFRFLAGSDRRKKERGWKGSLSN